MKPTTEVLRGGGWLYGEVANLRVAHSLRYTPSSHVVHVGGFRCFLNPRATKNGLAGS